MGGAREGLVKAGFTRVVSVDHRQQRDGENTNQPDTLTTFQRGAKHEGGLVLWVARRASVERDELAAVWASVDCTEEPLVRGMAKGEG